jgi:peroxin-13
MAAPKPWESSVPMSSQPMPPSFDPMNNGFGPTIEQPRAQGSAPPLPPRVTQQQQQQQQYGLYPPANYLNPYSYSPYQAGGYYNNYRLSPYGGPSNIPVSNFAQLAMDESRSAFSSIESVIHAFRSISLMLESTFTSVYSSFRAVTDVFDQFTRLRTQITAIYPLVLLWRFLKYLYHRLLRILHLRQATHGSTDETWSAIYQSLQQSTSNVNGQTTSTSSSSSSLLVALFFIVSFGTPMLMLKFLNSIIRKRQAASNWLEQDTNQARVVALYDYTARNSDELSFTKGTIIYLAPVGLQSTSSHWFLGSIDRIHTGLFPANYVQPMREATPSSINLRPQTPFNATTTTTTTVPPPPPPPPSSTVTNIPPSIFNGEEQPTLS